MKFWKDLFNAIRGRKEMNVEVELDERHLILVLAIVLFIVIYLIL